MLSFVMSHRNMGEKYVNSSQDGRSRLNVYSTVRLVELSKIGCHVKLHQNLISSYHVTVIFKARMSPKCNHNIFSSGMLYHKINNMPLLNTSSYIIYL